MAGIFAAGLPVDKIILKVILKIGNVMNLPNLKRGGGGGGSSRNCPMLEFLMIFVDMRGRTT
jgi:hypothetical protein